MLDGNSIEYEGKVFAGTAGWYDGSYYYKLSQGLYSESIMSFWCSYTNDAKLIPGLNDFYKLWDDELPKIKSALQGAPSVS